jgi:hypothetical protein
MNPVNQNKTNVKITFEIPVLVRIPITKLCVTSELIDRPTITNLNTNVALKNMPSHRLHTSTSSFAIPR